MSDPLAALRTSEVGLLLAVGLAATVTWSRLFPTLKPPAARGIVGLELAGSTARARRILADWEQRGLTQRAKRSVALDWPFIVLYSFAAALAGVLGGRAAAGSGLLSSDHADTVAAVLAYAAWAAGVLDVAENAGLRAMLSGHTGQPIPALASAASAAKWLLIAATVVGALALPAAAGIAALT